MRKFLENIMLLALIFFMIGIVISAYMYIVFDIVIVWVIVLTVVSFIVNQVIWRSWVMKKKRKAVDKIMERINKSDDCNYECQDYDYFWENEDE